jgi:hypothetical protein
MINNFHFYILLQSFLTIETSYRIYLNLRPFHFSPGFFHDFPRQLVFSVELSTLARSSLRLPTFLVQLLHRQ